MCRPQFVELAGSLLDHDSYSFEPARPMLQALEDRGVPVVPTSSKTRAEIEQIRSELGNRHPFIVENGAAVFIPCGYFPRQPEGTVEREGYWVYECSAGRSQWLQLLAGLEPGYPGEYEYFYRAGPAGISTMTGLGPAAAELASRLEEDRQRQEVDAAYDAYHRQPGSSQQRLILARLLKQRGRFLDAVELLQRPGNSHASSWQEQL